MVLEVEIICGYFRLREKRLIDRRSTSASRGATVTTREVAFFRQEDSELGLRKRANRMQIPLALRLELGTEWKS